MHISATKFRKMATRLTGFVCTQQKVTKVKAVLERLQPSKNYFWQLARFYLNSLKVASVVGKKMRHL